MRRRHFFSISLLLLVVAGGCAWGAWSVVQPSAASFLMPGALDVEVNNLALGQRLITYRMANPQDGWQTNVGRRLRSEGWQDPTETYVFWGATEQFSNTYTRHVQLWRFGLWEQALLDGNARNARITVRRWIDWR